MKLKDFFVKDINRTIETVIKADDQDHIFEEVVAYIVTDEVKKKIRDFFYAYNDYSGVNGVWMVVPFAEIITLIVSLVYIYKYRKEYMYENIFTKESVAV